MVHAPQRSPCFSRPVPSAWIVSVAPAFWGLPAPCTGVRTRRGHARPLWPPGVASGRPPCSGIGDNGETGGNHTFAMVRTL